MGIFSDLFGSKPPRPPPVFEHPDLGKLAWAGGCWEGTIEHGGRPIQISIAGAASSPNPEIVRASVASISRLAQLTDEAIRLIAAEMMTTDEGTIDRDKFTLVGVCHPLADQPEEFWLDLMAEGDDDGSWRVEFGPKPRAATPSDATNLPERAGDRERKPKAGMLDRPSDQATKRPSDHRP